MLSADDEQAPDECPITVSREYPKSDRLLEEEDAIVGPVGL